MPSKDNPGPDFWNRADQHIELANSQAEKAEQTTVSASLMFACSRYCVFVASQQAKSPHQLRQDREMVISYYLNQFKLMLEDNFDDYAGAPADT